MISISDPLPFRFRRQLETSTIHSLHNPMSATNELPQAGSGTAAFSAEASTSSPAFEQWRKSMAQFTGLGLSDSEQAERQRRLELQTLEKDWDRCEGWKKELMTTSGYFLPHT